MNAAKPLDPLDPAAPVEPEPPSEPPDPPEPSERARQREPEGDRRPPKREPLNLDDLFDL